MSTDSWRNVDDSWCNVDDSFDAVLSLVITFNLIASITALVILMAGDVLSPKNSVGSFLSINISTFGTLFT